MTVWCLGAQQKGMVIFMNTTGKNILNNFKDILGQYCAINQFVELSKRCFISEHTAQLSTREAFIELATQNHITLTSYNPDKMVNTISKSYIVNIHLCFETFLKNACREVKEFGIKEYSEKRQDDSWLKCARLNILGNIIPKEKQALFDLCEYYRLIRNTAVHDLCDVQSRKTEYEKLKKYDFKTDAKFAKLIAPNEYENITFDDFVMFSRSCVELATYLFNEIDYDYSKIVRTIPHTFRRYNDDRLNRAIFSYIHTWYKVDDRLNGQMDDLRKIIRA